MADEYDGEEIELGADDDDLGSPKSVAWKYAWSMNSSHPGNRSAASGTGDAASDRLYRGARSHRETRERLQREEQSRQDVTSERKQSHINKKSAAMMENRFDDVMNKTAIGRYRKEVKALASVRGGQRQGERVNGVFNYGDMLFQEGKMTSDKKERSRAEELRRRERHDPECTFRPKISEFADSGQFSHGQHMAERSDQLLVEHQEKLQALATAVRSQEDRELTFKPTITNKKSLRLAAKQGRDRDFVSQMEKSNFDHELKMQALRSKIEEQDRSSFTYRPEIRQTKQPSPESPSSRWQRACGGVALGAWPAHRMPGRAWRRWWWAALCVPTRARASVASTHVPTRHTPRHASPRLSAPPQPGAHRPAQAAEQGADLPAAVRAAHRRVRRVAPGGHATPRPPAHPQPTPHA